MGGGRQGGRVAILSGMGQVSLTQKVMPKQTRQASDGLSHRGIWGEGFRQQEQQCQGPEAGMCLAGLRHDTLNKTEIHSRIPTCPTIFCDSFRENLFPWTFVSSTAKRGGKGLGIK